MEHLNPRGARVVALEKPTTTERGQWYFQRYIQNLPTAGEMVFFDRSWYNRAGVERVMGFCEPNEYLLFMRQTPELERMLVASGIHLFKFWFSTTKALKITADDLKSLNLIDDVIEEPINGAHRDKESAVKALASYFVTELDKLEKLKVDELLNARIAKILSAGAFEEGK